MIEYSIPTLSSLRKAFKDFFNNHRQVRSYYYGDLDTYVSISDKEYFSVNIEYISSSVNGKYLYYQFNTTIADLMSMDYPESEHTAVNDCILIARDFLAYLTSIEVTYSSANIQPFREDTSDITAGVVVALSIQVPLGSNECATP